MKKLIAGLFSVIATLAVQAAEPLSLSWTNNMLRISGPNIPGEFVEIWYLEAFCRSGSTHQPWDKTTIPHKTRLIEANPQFIRLRTLVEPSVVLDHVIRPKHDEVDFQLEARNEGGAFVDIQWFQPCMRVNRFTGASQQTYIEKSFIFTQDGLQFLDKLPRTEEAIYRGGQVYVPPGIPLEDVNPRPISAIKPSNPLIGCISADGKKILATAWDQTQELFQGVIVCLHNDPRLGGLKSKETKKIRGKVYILENNPELLLRRYKADFSQQDTE